jgi:alkylation response protein AidB-like acyl-CoA dehydrogenase
MLLVLDEDQQLLAKTARELVVTTTPLSRVRRLRDSGDERGFSPEIWRQMAELGWTAIPFSEKQGGAGLGLTELALVTEAMGRRLAPEPLLSSVSLAGSLIASGDNAALAEQWLPSIISGEKLVTLAYQERGSRHNPFRVATRAERTGSGFALSGDKAHVLDGFGADAYVVTARTAGADGDRQGITLFFVPATTPGVSSVRQHRVDSRNAALVRMDSVELDQAAVLGAVDRGADLLEDALDRGTVALCGEMLGGMSEAFERTLTYLKERVQFGVVIGSFQALKHRAARMFIEIELSRSATMAAARAMDAGDPRARALVSVAKARCNDAYLLIANEAIQMHGGIGMTDEHDIGFFLKRARVAEMTFGDSAYHRDRFARLSGF